MSIDWWNVLTHSLWIAGLAVVLGLWGYADWRAWTGGRGVRQVPGALVRDPILYFGLALICLGAGLGVASWWQRLPWFLLLAAVATAGTWLGLARRKAGPS
jgi:hypothetical protein